MALKAAILGLALLLAVPATAAGVADGQRAYDAGRYDEARQIWAPLAQAGDAEAQNSLGLLYDLGDGVAQDATAALGWYRRAAQAGSLPASFNVGVMLDAGRGGPRDPAEAALWYARAAAQGHRRAQYNLGQLYETGDGVPVNPEVARAWYTAAAEALPAAAARAAGLPAPPKAARAGGPLGAPSPAWPAGAVRLLRGEEALVPLVWTAEPQPGPTRFFVEVMAVDAAPREVFATFVDASAALARLAPTAGRYAWRVYAVDAVNGRYAASAWAPFSILPPG